MGEEKPDEDLMGKRKSSPRLSTTSSDVDEFILSALWVIIHIAPKKMRFVLAFDLRASFSVNIKYGTISGTVRRKGQLQ
ncbi:MAG: hypothetical protein ACE3L7_04425 [Candidatus Pristimantibacillus sp.]